MINTKYKELKNKVKVYMDTDLSILDRAWEFAQTAHAGQKRLSGEEFTLHTLVVAHMVADWKLDRASVVAALVHDTIEWGGATLEDIKREFGEEVALLVDGVAMVTNLRLIGSKEERFVENLRKMLLVIARDLRVILIKLADRIHNMETLDALSADKQKENARETLEIYAPLAERMGMGQVKGKLEDLAFPYVYPREYKKVVEIGREEYEQAEETIEQMIGVISGQLNSEGVNALVGGRKKGLYSLWKKLERRGIDWDFDKINDIVALRIIVDDTSECYLALGIVHKSYKPVPHLGVSDYIAQPKPNGYRSIHTKVFGPNSRIVEIQIRTRKMHEEAEYGVAAHWQYSHVKSKGKVNQEKLKKEGAKVDESKLSWVRQLLAWQEEIKDSEEYVRAVKFDALSHRNFVFSPNGDVYDLPVGATPVDFAFAVHSDIGFLIKSAEVDGRIVSLDHKLSSGEVVQINKMKHPRMPNRDWLDKVVTAKARTEIKKALKRGKPRNMTS